MKRSEIILMILRIPVDFAMLILAVITAYELRFSEWAIQLKPVLFDITRLEFVAAAWWVALAWIFVFALTGLYSSDPNKKFSSELTRVFLGCSTGLALLSLYIFLTAQLFDSRFLVIVSWFFAIVYVTLGRLLIRGLKALLYRQGVGQRRIIVIGKEDTIVKTLRKRPELGYDVAGVYEHFDAEVRKKLRRGDIDELLFLNPRAHQRESMQALEFCAVHHITFKYSADLFATLSANMRVHPLAGMPIVELKPTSLEGWGRVIKRICDIIGSIIILIVFSPLYALVALGVVLETGRPVIYRNKRVGIRGKTFFTLKFRSMHQKDSTGEQFGRSGKKALEKEQQLIESQNSKKGPIYKIKNDPRVTRFGRFLRRFSLDELPQFYNVLVGEMSIVGPRPHQPREVKEYDTKHSIVFTLKPGITGLSQISGRSDLSFEEEMRLDTLYIEKWSLLLDLIIFFKTPFVLFKKRNVE